MPDLARYGWWAAAAVAVLVLALGAGLLLRDPVPEPAPGPATTRPPAPGVQPGSRTVRFTADAAAHPHRGAVQHLLQAHFDAINLGDYAGWASTVVRERAAGTSEDEWREQYETTVDGSILVHRLEPSPGGGLTVLLSFTSVQDPADAPEDAPFRCLRWRVSYRVVSESGGLRLALADPETSRKARCG